MKIAVFLYSFQVGGVEKVFITLLNEWVRLGHKVYVFILKNEGELKDTVDENIIKIDLKCSNLWKSFFKIPYLLQKYEIEYFMVAKDTENVFFSIMKLIYGCSCKIIISQHNYNSIYFTEKKSLKAKIVTKLMHKTYRYSDHIICVTKGIESFVKTLNIYEKQTTVIYNPLDVGLIQKEGEMAIDESGDFVIFCGRFSKVKNISLLIDAFKIFHQTHNKYKLLLIGEGPEEEHLKQKVSEYNLINHVRFIGSVSNPHCYVSKAKILVLSSFSEAFSMTICEAFANGITVVTTPSGGPNELVEDGRGYLLNSLFDPEEMAKMMSYACEHPINPNLLKDYVIRFKSSRVAQLYIDTFAKL